MTVNKLRATLLCVLAVPAMAAFANDDHNHDHDQVSQRSREMARAKAAMKQAQLALANAQQVLERSMREARGLNVIAIVTKCGDCLQRLKVEQKANGGQMSTVLQPLSMQGVTLLNNGSQSFTYWPDQRIVVECDSDNDDDDDVDLRASLAAKNYALHMASDVELIAGRSTYCVTADPKIAGLPARQFYLDEQTLYPLRITQETENGWKTSMDTQVVNFPKDMPQIDLQLVGTPRKVKFDPAQSLSSIRNVKDRLGFEPVIPKHLPYGFEIQRAELRRNEDGQLAMLWLTDGLATARVYEFRCNQMREGIWSQGSSTVLTEDGTTMMLVSDLNPEVRRSLLSAFAHRIPSAIPPPAASTVPFGVRPPPVPSEEPRTPSQSLTFPEPETGGNIGSTSNSSSDSVAIGQANNVKGE